MKNIKTYEGFFDIFKKKKSEDDKIVMDYIKRLEHLKSYLEKGGVAPYDITTNPEGTEPGEKYFSRYRFQFDDSPIRIVKVEADRKYPKGWNEESQKSFFEQGAVKKNNHVFFLLDIENVDETVKADVDLMEELFELAHFCYKQNKENKRIKKIRGNMNPAADLLDDDIWGDIPLDKR
jgi:hypothetical protein